ncbi:MAG: hypothetical protein ACLSV2_01920 [Clostridium sp.]
MKNIKNTLKEITKLLNTHEAWEEEFWTYKLELKDNDIICKIYDDENIEYIMKIEKVEGIENILKEFIGHLYEEEINYRTKFIRGSKGYNNRKIKSLCTWTERGKQEKVDDIVKELTSRYKITKRLESDVRYYKTFISDLYKCLDKLCPELKEIKNESECC